MVEGEFRPRMLALQGCLNVRDLGGYPVAGGGVTKYRRVLRGDCLHEIGARGWSALVDDGVRTVVDLRSPSEVGRQPADPHEGVPVARLHLPLHGDGVRFDRRDEFPDMLSIYRHWVDNSGDAIARILDAVATSAAPAVLLHCWSGKDRTGVVAALLLRLAGVDVTTVAWDYALSADLLAPRVPVWREAAIRAGIADPQIAVDASAATMLGLLRHVDARHGDAAGYARSIGLHPARIGALRALLVTGGETAPVLSPVA